MNNYECMALVKPTLRNLIENILKLLLDLIRMNTILSYRKRNKKNIRILHSEVFKFS